MSITKQSRFNWCVFHEIDRWLSTKNQNPNTRFPFLMIFVVITIQKRTRQLCLFSFRIARTKIKTLKFHIWFLVTGWYNKKKTFKQAFVSFISVKSKTSFCERKCFKHFNWRVDNFQALVPGLCMLQLSCRVQFVGEQKQQRRISPQRHENFQVIQWAWKIYTGDYFEGVSYYQLE